jgi:hypothetical protein
MPKGDAGDFSYGDMLRNEAEINAANIQYTETARQSYGDDKDAAEEMAKTLRDAATKAKNGAVVTVKNTGSRQKPDYAVIVEVPKKGKK